MPEQKTSAMPYIDYERFLFIFISDYFSPE